MNRFEIHDDEYDVNTPDWEPLVIVKEKHVGLFYKDKPDTYTNPYPGRQFKKTLPPTGKNKRGLRGAAKGGRYLLAPSDVTTYDKSNRSKDRRKEANKKPKPPVFKDRRIGSKGLQSFGAIKQGLLEVETGEVSDPRPSFARNRTVESRRQVANIKQRNKAANKHLDDDWDMVKAELMMTKTILIDQVIAAFKVNRLFPITASSLVKGVRNCGYSLKNCKAIINAYNAQELTDDRMLIEAELLRSGVESNPGPCPCDHDSDSSDVSEDNGDFDFYLEQLIQHQDHVTALTAMMSDSAYGLNWFQTRLDRESELMQSGNVHPNPGPPMLEEMCPFVDRYIVAQKIPFQGRILYSCPICGCAMTRADVKRRKNVVYRYHKEHEFSFSKAPKSIVDTYYNVQVLELEYTSWIPPVANKKEDVAYSVSDIPVRDDLSEEADASTSELSSDSSEEVSTIDSSEEVSIVAPSLVSTSNQYSILPEIKEKRKPRSVNWARQLILTKKRQALRLNNNSVWTGNLNLNNLFIVPKNNVKLNEPCFETPMAPDLPSLPFQEYVLRGQNASSADRATVVRHIAGKPLLRLSGWQKFKRKMKRFFCCIHEDEVDPYIPEHIYNVDINYSADKDGKLTPVDERIVLNRNVRETATSLELREFEYVFPSEGRRQIRPIVSPVMGPFKDSVLEDCNITEPANFDPDTFRSTETVRVVYCPHIVTCVLSECTPTVNLDVFRTNLPGKIARLATLPIPDVLHARVVSGTIEVVLAMLSAKSASYFH